MIDRRIWIKRGERAHAMVPCVGAAEFSPDDAFLAWDDGLAPGVVRVTEAASLSTVARLDRGGRVEAMCWSSPDTLCLFRRNAHEERSMHVHAIPDGGLVASAPLPAMSGWWGDAGPIQRLPPSRRRMRVQTSPNARAALLTWPDVKALFPPESLGACLLRGERFERADIVNLAANLTAGNRQARIDDVALSPDGTSSRSRSCRRATRGARSCRATARCARVAMPLGLAPKLMRWVGPASVLTAWGPARSPGETRFMLVEAPATVKTLAISGADFMFGASSDFDFEFDLDPERENAVATALRRTAVQSSTWALVLPTDASSARAATTLPLHAPELAGVAYLGGGACWDARGHLLTLTAMKRSEARLSRRANPTDTPEAVLQLELTGKVPHALSLTPSPTRRHALVRWESQDTDRPDERERAVVLVTLG